MNDALGHAEGDRVLLRFAQILRSSSRAMNVTARFGGEEFIAILRSPGSDGARTYAERVRERLRAVDLPYGPVTVSAGVAEYEDGMASPDVIVAAADQALYRAKNAGRDRVVVIGRQGRRPVDVQRSIERDEGELPRGRGELVLVVDDDVDALRSVARTLRRFGYSVFESPSASGAVEIVQGLDEPLHLVITDVVMPEMGGFRLVELRVAFVSGGLPAITDGLSHMKADVVVLDLDLAREELETFVDVLAKQTFGPAVLALSGSRNGHLRERARSLAWFDSVNRPFAMIELETRVRNLFRARSCEKWIATLEEDVRGRVAARTAELEEAREEVLRRLAWAAEFRDDLTGYHAERVGVLSGLIARQLGWPAAERVVIEKAAPLHDLGKIAIPDSILKKTGKLTPAEQDVMRSHTTVGAQLLSGSRNQILQAAEQIALTHHEWWDGGGYPRGLVGEAIPQVGTVVAVADAFDSLTNHRPYRDGVSREEALSRIQASAGSQFDPGIAAALLAVVESGALEEALNLEVIARPDRSVTRPVSS